MEFDINRSIEILRSTPSVLRNLLSDLDDAWLTGNEGDDTWSPFDVVGHLVHGEKTDWIDRMQIILSDNEDKTFKPFDRFAQFEDSKGKNLGDLLEEFEMLRSRNLNTLISTNIETEQLKSKGVHPALGEVTLKELLSTWVVHDLGHIGQITRVMAKQYKDEVGPWREYLGVLNR